MTLSDSNDRWILEYPLRDDKWIPSTLMGYDGNRPDRHRVVPLEELLRAMQQGNVAADNYRLRNVVTGEVIPCALLVP